MPTVLKADGECQAKLQEEEREGHGRGCGKGMGGVETRYRLDQIGGSFYQKVKQFYRGKSIKHKRFFMT